MYYLRNFLFVFSLRFGCQVTAYIEIVVYCYTVYYMITEFGFNELMQSMIIICLATSCVLSFLMLASTLQEHESSGIIFTYVMWAIFTTSFFVIYFMYTAFKGTPDVPFIALIVLITIIRCYSMMVVISFMHMLVTSDSEDSM